MSVLPCGNDLVTLKKCDGPRPYYGHIRCVLTLILTMTTNPPSDSISIFKDGKLKPGVYKIQNIYFETYLDIEVHSRGVCCRPANDLGEAGHL